MSEIYNFTSGINTYHALNHVSEARQSDYWVFLCCNTPFLIDTDEGTLRGESGDFIITEPYKQRRHTNVPEAETGFINSWFHINGKGISDIIKKYGFEPDILYHTVDSAIFVQDLTDLQNEIYSRRIYSDDMALLLFTKLVINLSRQNALYNTHSFHDNIKFQEINKLRERMLENYTNQYTVKSLAREMNISSEYFAALYKKIFEISPMKDLNTKRMAAARTLLISTDMSISEIAEKCGYSDANYFSRLFKKFTGMSPGEFRK